MTELEFKIPFRSGAVMRLVNVANLDRLPERVEDIIETVAGPNQYECRFGAEDFGLNAPRTLWSIDAWRENADQEMMPRLFVPDLLLTEEQPVMGEKLAVLWRFQDDDVDIISGVVLFDPEEVDLEFSFGRTQVEPSHNFLGKLDARYRSFAVLESAVYLPMAT